MNYAKQMFPVLNTGISVPWALVEPFEPQAIKNHAQTLTQLAQRGGLSALELWAVMHGVTWRQARSMPNAPSSDAEALPWVRELVDVHAKMQRYLTLLREALASHTLTSGCFSRNHVECASVWGAIEKELETKSA